MIKLDYKYVISLDCCLLKMQSGNRFITRAVDDYLSPSEVIKIIKGCLEDLQKTED